MRTRTRILILFLLFVGIILCTSVDTSTPKEKYGFRGRPPSRLELLLIRLCHRLHIRTKFDDEFDEEMEQLKQQEEALVRHAKQEQEQSQKQLEQFQKWIKEDERALKEKH